MPPKTARSADEPAAPPAPGPEEGQSRERSRRGRYISESILERRRRMLEVAKQMIAEGGEDAFTIRELGRRAKVSVTTIYATYGDKEGLIAAAIADYYEGLPTARAPQTLSLQAVLGATDSLREAILANRAYARQYAELYFSNSVDPRVHKVIRETATASAGGNAWLQKAMREGDIVPGLDMDYITGLFANHRLMVLHDWARGRIGDDDLIGATKMNFLIMARGVTRGATQARVEAELKKLLRATRTA